MPEILASTFVLAVADLDASRRFYIDKLGFVEEMRVDGWSFLRRGACRLRLGDCPGIKPISDSPDHSWFAYLHVRDAMRLYGEFVGNGVEIWHTLADQPWGMREFAIVTPDGHRIVFGEQITQTIYEAAGGKQAFIALAYAWHARCLADPIVSHAFSHGYHPEHTERLAAYWAEALGGPHDYTESIGSESQVIRMHAGNGEHREMDERAQICFAQALDDAAIPNDPRLRAALKDYFRWATERMSGCPESADDVPHGLEVACWSWNGPV